MLRIPSVAPADRRELQHWQFGGDARLARRAQFVLWSARGWSVPALARALGCCRRTVRMWLHAFLDAGLVGLLGRFAEAQESRQEPMADSAMVLDASTTGGRLVPVVPLSVPEVRRILAFHWHPDPVSPEFFWHWSIWRRYKQALAMRSYYQKRGAVAPDFEYLRL